MSVSERDDPSPSDFFKLRIVFFFGNFVFLRFSILGLERGERRWMDFEEDEAQHSHK